MEKTTNQNQLPEAAAADSGGCGKSGASRSGIVLAALVGLVLGFVVHDCFRGSQTELDIGPGSGDVRESPDGRWLANMRSGDSAITKQRYAVIRLLDLRLVPARKRSSKRIPNIAPYMKLSFPQDYRIGVDDKGPDIEWNTNSTTFTIRYLLRTDATGKREQRQFVYHIDTDTFWLSATNWFDPGH